MAKIKLSATQARDKWARNMKSSAEDMRIGVENVTEAPGTKAAAAQDKWFAGIQEAFTSGRWKAAVAKISLEEWKEKMLKKGIPRIQTGVDASLDKTLKAMETNFANIESVLNKVDSMPSTTFQDRLERMVAFATEMHNKKS